MKAIDWHTSTRRLSADPPVERVAVLTWRALPNAPVGRPCPPPPTECTVWAHRPCRVCFQAGSSTPLPAPPSLPGDIFLAIGLTSSPFPPPPLPLTRVAAFGRIHWRTSRSCVPSGLFRRPLVCVVQSPLLSPGLLPTVTGAFPRRFPVLFWIFLLFFRCLSGPSSPSPLMLQGNEVRAGGQTQRMASLHWFLHPFPTFSACMLPPPSCFLIHSPVPPLPNPVDNEISSQLYMPAFRT